jgi:beta-glucosidase/6-phospho-beta-glucosidase/beta-galactosidase
VIPEITITCNKGTVFINSITVEQYKKYAALMEKNNSDKITDAMFFNSKIVQEIFGNTMSLDEIGKTDTVEFLTAAKGIHFIMQEIISQKLLEIVKAEQIEKEESAFDEYDRENGYEDEQSEKNEWEICSEIVDRVVKIAIRLLNNSYSDCMKEDIIYLLKYLKFELDTIDENQE